MAGRKTILLLQLRPRFALVLVNQPSRGWVQSSDSSCPHVPTGGARAAARAGLPQSAQTPASAQHKEPNSFLIRSENSKKPSAEHLNPGLALTSRQLQASN